MRADDNANAARHPGELLDGDRIGERVEAGASHLLWIRDAQQAQRCRLADDLVRELALAFELVNDRRDPPLGEVAYRPANLLVLRGEREIHGRRDPRMRDEIGANESTQPRRNDGGIRPS